MSISKGPCESDWLPWDVIGPPKSQPFCMCLAYLQQTPKQIVIKTCYSSKWRRKSASCKRDVSLVHYTTDHDGKKSHHKLLLEHYLILFCICWLPHWNTKWLWFCLVLNFTGYFFVLPFWRVETAELTYCPLNIAGIGSVESVLIIGTHKTLSPSLGARLHAFQAFSTCMRTRDTWDTIRRDIRSCDTI